MTTRRGLGLWPVLLVVAAVYCIGAWLIAETRSIWSPDSGARLVQVQSILEHGPDWAVSYPAKDLDPGHKNSPLSFYEYNHNGKTYVFYSFVFALATAPFFKWFGFFGLAVLPILGGLLAVAAVYHTAQQTRIRYPAAPALLTGLATPLALYSVVFWDHAILAGIATVALLLAMRGVERNCGGHWLATGLALGAGMWLHEILAPYFLAFIFGAWWLRRRHKWTRNCGMLLLGGALMVVPLLLVNKAVYGSFAGPHLSNNKLGSPQAVMAFILNPMEWGLGALYTLFGWGDANPAFTWQLKDWVAQPWPRFAAEIEASKRMAIPVLAWMILGPTRLWRFWPVTLLALAGMGGVFYWCLTHGEWAHSPFYACPLLLLAFLAPLGRERSVGEDAEQTTGRLLLQMTAVVTAAYTLLTLVKPTLGGTEWGSRHLLTTVPALVLLGWAAMERLLPERRGLGELAWRPGAPVALASGAVLALLSTLLTVHGGQVVVNMQRNSRTLADAIAAAPDQVIVTSVWWAPMNAAPAYLEKKILFADQEHPAPQLLTRLRGAGVKSFTLLGYRGNDLMDFAVPIGYIPVQGAGKPAPLGLATNRYLFVEEAPASPPSEDLPPVHGPMTP